MESDPGKIRFFCTCGVGLEVGADRAGSSIQCPKCGRLIDVPTLSELASIAEDGTYRIDEPERLNEADRLAKLHRSFSRQRVDEFGNEIDLRESFQPEELDQPLNEDDVLEVIEETPYVPKYDPETGELIRAVPLRNEPEKINPAAVPMAKAVINYAGVNTEGRFRAWQIIGELFRFQNMVVILIVFAAHLVIQLAIFPVLIGMLTVVPGVVFLLGALVAHYANVVNDTGFEGMDELPRPLRDLNWSEDIWKPFLHFATALFVCYGGLLAMIWLRGVTAWAVGGTVLIVGTVGFPAVLLTTTSSGTILNLVPDRLLRVVGALGLSYFVAVILWAVTIVLYASGAVTSMLVAVSLIAGGKPHLFGVSIPGSAAYGALFVAIMLMHGFCWYLGLKYRLYHDDFNWLLQHHHRTLPPVVQPTAEVINRGRPPM